MKPIVMYKVYDGEASPRRVWGYDRGRRPAYMERNDCRVKMFPETFNKGLFPKCTPSLTQPASQTQSVLQNLSGLVIVVNGSCGVIEDIMKPDNDCDVRFVVVDFPNYRGPSLSPSRPNVVPITQIRATNRNGLSLTLACARYVKIPGNDARPLRPHGVTVWASHGYRARGLNSTTQMDGGQPFSSQTFCD